MKLRFTLMTPEQRAERERMAAEEDADPMRLSGEYSSGQRRGSLGAPNASRMALECDDARRRLIAKGRAVEIPNETA